MKTILNLKYYLDTCVVQALGKRLRSIPANKGVYTSQLTIMELLKKIENEDSFNRIRGALVNIIGSDVIPILLPPYYILYDAYGIKYNIDSIFKSYETIVGIVLEANNYTDFRDMLKKQKLIDVFDSIKKIFDESSKYFKERLEQHNENGDLKENIKIFKTRWDGRENRQKRLYEGIDYYAQKVSRRCSQPLVNLLVNYNHSIDYFVQISYHYDDRKNYSKDLAERNDGFDLLHLLYLRNGCHLVTDDTGFQKCVNEVYSGLAIGKDQFLNEVNGDKESV